VTPTTDRKDGLFLSLVVAALGAAPADAKSAPPPTPAMGPRFVAPCTPDPIVAKALPPYGQLPRFVGKTRLRLEVVEQNPGTPSRGDTVVLHGDAKPRTIAKLVRGGKLIDTG